MNKEEKVDAIENSEIIMIDRLVEQLVLVINSERSKTNFSYDDIDCLESARAMIARVLSKKELRRRGGGITYGDF